MKKFTVLIIVGIALILAGVFGSRLFEDSPTQVETAPIETPAATSQETGPFTNIGDSGTLDIHEVRGPADPVLAEYRKTNPSATVDFTASRAWILSKGTQRLGLVQGVGFKKTAIAPSASVPLPVSSGLKAWMKDAVNFNYRCE